MNRADVSLRLKFAASPEIRGCLLLALAVGMLLFPACGPALIATAVGSAGGTTSGVAPVPPFQIRVALRWGEEAPSGNTGPGDLDLRIVAPNGQAILSPCVPSDPTGGAHSGDDQCSAAQLNQEVAEWPGETQPASGVYKAVVYRNASVCLATQNIPKIEVTILTSDSEQPTIVNVPSQLLGDVSDAVEIPFGYRASSAPASVPTPTTISEPCFARPEILVSAFWDLGDIDLRIEGPNGQPILSPCGLADPTGGFHSGDSKCGQAPFPSPSPGFPNFEAALWPRNTFPARGRYTVVLDAIDNSQCPLPQFQLINYFVQLTFIDTNGEVALQCFAGQIAPGFLTGLTFDYRQFSPASPLNASDPCVPGGPVPPLWPFPPQPCN